MLTIEPHPLMDLRAYTTTFPRPLGEIPPQEPILHLLKPGTDSPLAPQMTASDDVRAAVRDLLRHGGFKPTGRSKPASEYLLRAAAEGIPSINAAVDACNAVSLHSGLPISVVDLDLVSPPLRVGLAPQGASYVFNSAGQSIDLSGLLVLFDSAGPTASPVKDSHRSKTHPATRKTLTLIWGSLALPGRAEGAMAWRRELLHSLGAETELISLHDVPPG